MPWTRNRAEATWKATPREKKNQFVGPERVSFSIQWSAALAVAAACGGEEKWEQRREFGS
jgi:hypothetical protein